MSPIFYRHCQPYFKQNGYNILNNNTTIFTQNATNILHRIPAKYYIQALFYKKCQPYLPQNPANFIQNVAHILNTLPAIFYTKY